MKIDDESNSEIRHELHKLTLSSFRHSWCAHGDSPYMTKSSDTRNTYSDCYSSSSSLSMFDSDADRVASGVKCTCMSERGVPEGQEDPSRAMRPKIEIELEENEALEAYNVEKECGNIVEDPPVKLEMPNTNPQASRYFQLFDIEYNKKVESFRD